MRSLFLCVAGVLVLFGPLALKQTRATATDGAAAREALLETDRQFAAAARAGDMKRIFDFWTEDAVNFFPGAPPARGRQAIQAMVRRNRARPGFSLSWKAADAVVSRSGELGYTIGSFQLSVEDEKGKPRTQRGNYVCVWAKQPGGAWKIAVDCGTFSAARVHDPSRAR